MNNEHTRDLVRRLREYAANPSIVYGFIPVFPNTLIEAADCIEALSRALHGDDPLPKADGTASALAAKE